MIRRILLVALCGALSGCWYTQLEHGTVSTRRMDPGKSYAIDYSERVSGADRAHNIWLIPLGFPGMHEAVEKTITEAEEDKKGRKVIGLYDAEVKFHLLWLYWYSMRWYTVEGYPIYEVK